MKVFAAAAVNNGGDHYVFVATSKDGIYDQIVEMGRHEGGDREYYEEHYADEYSSYEDYLFDQYWIQAEEEFDL